MLRRAQPERHRERRQHEQEAHRVLLDESIARDALRVHVVLAERPDDELPDNGRVLFEEGVANPVRGAGKHVRQQVTEKEGREHEPGGGAGSQGKDDAGE